MNMDLCLTVVYAFFFKIRLSVNSYVVVCTSKYSKKIMSGKVHSAERVLRGRV